VALLKTFDRKRLGWFYFALICVLTIAAPILLIATNGGAG
jgi:hypothetical protein